MPVVVRCRRGAPTLVYSLAQPRSLVAIKTPPSHSELAFFARCWSPRTLLVGYGVLCQRVSPLTAPLVQPERTGRNHGEAVHVSILGEMGIQGATGCSQLRTRTRSSCRSPSAGIEPSMHALRRRGSVCSSTPSLMLSRRDGTTRHYTDDRVVEIATQWQNLPILPGDRPLIVTVTCPSPSRFIYCFIIVTEE